MLFHLVCLSRVAIKLQYFGPTGTPAACHHPLATHARAIRPLLKPLARSWFWGLMRYGVAVGDVAVLDALPCMVWLVPKPQRSRRLVQPIQASLIANVD